MNIDKKLHGKNINKLLFKKNKKFKGEIDVTAIIVDEELDAFECSFNNDGCVTINTDGMSYIVLSYRNLHTLERLIEEAETYFEDKF